MRPRPSVLIAVLSVAIGCATPAARTLPVEQTGDEVSGLQAEIARLEDRRDGQGRLEALARHAHPAVRARAVWALGRIQDVRTVDTILERLQDSEANVRREGAFASGLLLQSWDALPDGVEPRIVAALIETEGREGEEGAQLRMLEALGKIPTASEVVEARLRDRLSDGRPAIAARAALSLGLIARRTQKLDERSVVAALGTLRRDAPQPLRYAGAYALAFAKAPQARPALVTCAEDPDADVRALCVRGLAEVGTPEDAAALGARLRDEDPRVAAEAVRALAKHVERCTADACPALDALKETTGWVAQLTSSPAWNQPLLAFAQVGLPPRGAEVLALVRGAVSKALAAAPTPDLAWLDCRFAAAQDRLSGALKETLACGKELIAEDRRIAIGLNEIARTPVAEGQTRHGEAWIPYLTHARPTVRNAALAALAASNTKAAISAIRELLTREDPITAGNAAFALATLGDRASVPAIRSLLSRVPQDPDLAPVADALADLVKPTDPRTPEEEAQQKALAEDVAQTLRPWLASPHANVRGAAAAALQKLTGESIRPDVVPFPPLEGTAPPGTRLTFHRKDAAFLQPIPPPGAQLRFDTEKGSFTVTLDAIEAPLTSANLFALARSGYFDGLTFHRVVPDFVAQGGDPRGDGEGGPGHSIRCEIGHRTYARGAFGMALSGKDTGGSQFFVTTSPQPHLDGRYTNFGQVTSGMEVVDRLLEGDRILRVEAVSPSQ